MGKRKYNTEEERKAAQREYSKQYYQNNKEKLAKQMAERYKQKKDEILVQQAEYRKNNRDKIQAKNTKYRLTPKGRAVNLLHASYKKADKKYNRGECTLTADWIIENIFSQPCHYCGETDWTKMGCDRIDNSLPHTPENCVPCCEHCNELKGTRPYDEFMRLIKKVG